LNRQTVDAGRALRRKAEAGTRGAAAKKRSFDRRPRHRFSNSVLERCVGRHEAGALASGFRRKPVETGSPAKKFCAIIRVARSAIAANLPVIRAIHAFRAMP
jgi:hypothetical protein